MPWWIVVAIRLALLHAAINDLVLPLRNRVSSRSCFAAGVIFMMS